MPIPEHQLATWSGLGAQQASQETYNSVRTALAQHPWPQGMDHKVYLQGSYRNHTNIRGDSDVDIVVETSTVFQSNLTPKEKARLRFYPGGYQWDDFRHQVKLTLTTYYGAGAVSERNKCLKVAGSGNRLNADVVPCMTYRNYDKTLTLHAAGITFRTRACIWIINYPKLHYDHGVLKNRACGENYRPNIRVFKNARNWAGNDFPSYFLECLLFNIPPDSFTNSHADTFEAALNYLLGAQNTGSLAAFVCQNGQQHMFGTALHQTSLESAHVLIGSLVNLWNNWP